MTSYLQKLEELPNSNFAFMIIMTHAKFQFNRLMLTLIFGIWAFDPYRALRTTEKARPNRVK